MGRGYVFGALAVYAVGFREDLLAEGYTEGSAERLIHLMAHVSRWLDSRGLKVAEFGAGEIEAFVADRRADGYVGWRSARALAPMLEYLEGLGVCIQEGGESSAGDRLRDCYRAYLIGERGVAPASLRSYLGVARRFVERLGLGEQDLSILTAAAVTTFVTDECARRSPGSASATMTGMRSFLRFL